MKKRNKKYNSMKGALKSAKVGLRNLAVYHSKRDNKEKYTCFMVNIKTGEQVNVGTSMAFAVSEIKHKCSIFLLAIGVDANGKNYFKVDPVPLKHEMKQSDLVDYLDERHKKFIANSFNKNQLTNVAWLASMNGDDITDEQIDNILTKHGGW